MHKTHPHLHHIDLKNHYQFITFCTYDSVDAYMTKLAQQKINNRQRQWQIDQYADTSNKGAYLNGDVLQWFSDFLHNQHQQSYELIAFSIMPNHVHLLIKPLMPLDKIMQFIKGVSARYINQQLKYSGKFWAKDYYDKFVRDQEHFLRVYAYIKNNPNVLKENNNPTRFYGILE